jgi:ABC-type phosphate/phosphonate transport system substrate-binding protein
VSGPQPLILGAVAYDPKVVTIWNGFRDWLRGRGLDFDYVLYSHYEKQVEDLVAGRIDVAWNSPLAWVRARRLAAASGREVSAIAMRDSDCDLTSVIVARSDSAITTVEGLRGRRVATGAIDSPQATLLPLAHLQAAGLIAGKDFEARRFDIGVGLHGDHVGGERDAARALIGGEVDAACMLDASHLAFTQEGTLPAGSTRVIAQTPAFDHCAMTAGPVAPAEAIGQLRELLLSMSYADDSVRPLLDLEGLKAWRPGRTGGYAQLEAAVDALDFYDREGRIVAAGYRP